MPLIKAEHVRQFEEQGKDYSDSEHRAGRREAVEKPSRIVLTTQNGGENGLPCAKLTSPHQKISPN